MSKLSRKRILLTTGPTQEPIDPVRYISNHSSGKMGFAIAKSALEKGANVLMIKGPTSISFDEIHPNIEIIEVQTAEEMYLEVKKYIQTAEIAIFAAAVADYTPKHKAATKIKKNENVFHLELTKTKDIACEMGKLKLNTQFFVGFALETNDEERNALQKLKKKNLDMIVLNSLQDKGAGFQTDTNKITILDKRGNVIKFDTKSKLDTAADILNYIEEQL